MNGQEVLMEIKQNPRWKRIPVVIMTASTAEKDLLSAYDRHANCFVTKPVTMDKFLEAVRSIEDFWLSVVRLPAA
jgi:CheY-like chemotaxis protein